MGGQEKISVCKFLYDTDEHALIGTQSSKLVAFNLAGKGKKSFEINFKHGLVTGIESSQLQDHAFVCFEDGNWNVVNLERKESIAEINSNSSITASSLHHDGLILATGHINGAVKLWDLRTQKLAFELKSDLVEEVTSLNFSLKGALLAATSKDNVATRLLNIKKQNEQSLILEHGGKTNFTTFD